MKVLSFLPLALSLGALVLRPAAASAQSAPPPRPFNPLGVQFRRLWQFPLTEPVKLLDIGPVTNEKKNSVVFLAEGRESDDFHRRLLITHWDGLKFAEDSAVNFVGTTLDTLLVGHFRDVKSKAVAKPGKKPVPVSGRQIITTNDIYEWSDNLLTKIFPAPSGVKLAVESGDAPSVFLAGLGDATVNYALTETEVRPLKTFALPPEGTGYARLGIGTQDYKGADKMRLSSGARYVQSYWRGRSRWMIALLPGQATAGTSATTGDKLVVYTPKFASRDKNFWIAGFDDLEEAWRSDPIPGRVLDVRVGDPKNEGRLGIVVLTAENNGKDRSLIFFGVTQGPSGN